MNKCEWKDGFFAPCDKAMDLFKAPMELYDYLDECPFCGADIRKPEPEIIIKGSGETWVLNNYGIDYLFLGCDISDEHLIKSLFDSYNKEDNELFKPISKIKITDEIAKLRPMIINDNGYMTTLYGVCYDNIILGDGTFEKESYRLATVSDL